MDVVDCLGIASDVLVMVLCSSLGLLSIIRMMRLEGNEDAFVGCSRAS